MMQIGEPHPDRNAQFEYINATAAIFLESGTPVISVDTKKKEKTGNFKKDGGEYRPKNQRRKVFDHDFPIKELGKIARYGVYHVNNNYESRHERVCGRKYFALVGNAWKTHFSKCKKTVHNG
jgi:hypothetical protein